MAPITCCAMHIGRTSIGACVLASIVVIVGCSAPIKNEPGPDAQDAQVSRVDENIDAGDVQTGIEPEIPFRTVAEAQARISDLGPTPTPLDLAWVISEIQEWPVRLDEEEPFQALQSAQLIRLRQLVVTEVRAHQDAALKAQTSPDSAKKFADAQRILVLYPMSDEEQVITEAQQLSDRQGKVSQMLESLRRQRYNQWAVQEIEKALNYLNENKSRSVLSDRNKALIDPLVSMLGKIDPVYLEPVASDLYKSLIDKVKGSLSDENWRQFARAINNPRIVRKALGEI